MSTISYTAPPTCAQFMKSDAFFRLIAGPVGSGKTTACLFELFRRACEQKPADDGYRYTRFAIVRQSLKQLKDTVLKDVLSWLKDVADYRVSESTIYIEVGDVRSEWLLIPLDTPEDQRRLLSMQLTGSWMSEIIDMDMDLVPSLAGRCGRYPAANMGGATWMGIIADTNFPSEGSDWYKFMETDVPADTQIFKQPGGLDEGAENLEWLTQTPDSLRLPPEHPDRQAQGRKYYERLARTSHPDWVRRYVHAQYGNDPSGSAVFRETFRQSFHVVDELQPVATMPIIIGQDFGRDPWSIICQLDHKGRMLVLEEVAAEDIGLELHIQQSLKPKLFQERYLGRPIAIIGDPSGTSKSSIYEESTFDVMKRMGLVAFPAPTNDIDPRLRAIDAFLLSARDGGPGFLVDRSRCPTIVRALGGGYRYAKTKAGVRKPVPDKNEYSHPIDALQYACLAAHGGMSTMITQRLRAPVHIKTTQFSSAAWT
jgi:hypothetical protein